MTDDGEHGNPDSPHPQNSKKRKRVYLEDFSTFSRSTDFLPVLFLFFSGVETPHYAKPLSCRTHCNSEKVKKSDKSNMVSLNRVNSQSTRHPTVTPAVRGNDRHMALATNLKSIHAKVGKENLISNERDEETDVAHRPHT